MVSKKRSPEPICRPLGPLLNSIERAYPDRGHRIWEVWETAVGEELAARCQPLEFTNGRLAVGVSSSTWMQQIQFLLPRLRESLNANLGEALVRDIRLRVQNSPPPTDEVRRSDPDVKPEWLTVPVPETTLRKIEADLDAVADPELRTALLKVRVRAEQLRLFREAREG